MGRGRELFEVVLRRRAFRDWTRVTWFVRVRGRRGDFCGEDTSRGIVFERRREQGPRGRWLMLIEIVLTRDSETCCICLVGLRCRQGRSCDMYDKIRVMSSCGRGSRTDEYLIKVGGAFDCTKWKSECVRGVK